ncbi:MAG: non-heme iron oxygenase ferredoxin subunit [Burkholderiaceae bacterium]
MWIPIAKSTDEVGEHGNGYEVDGEFVALFRLDGCYFATSNVCTHQFALLTEGCVDGEFVTCPMHQGRFHIPSGAAQGAPVSEPIRTFPVRVVDGVIEIELAQGEAA